MKPQEIEIINAGKKIIRTNIVPHYLPIDESQITTIEVSNFDSEGTHTETIYPEPVVDHWTYDERVEYKTCYALLTFGQYFDLNYKISMLQGYDLSLPTERYAPINPRLAKVNINVVNDVETYDILCVLELTVEVQEKCVDLLTGLTLVDLTEITFSEEQPTVIEATGLTTEQVDWTLAHTAATNPDLEVIYLLDSPPSPESEQAIQQIVSQGTTVIVADEN